MAEKYPIDYNFDDNVVYIPILVKNLTQAKQFYKDVFGFEPFFLEAESLGWVELSLPIKGVILGLDLETEMSIEKETRNASFTLSVRNIDETFNYFKEKKIECGDIRDIPSMVSLLDCWDPFGNLIQIMAPPRKK